MQAIFFSDLLMCNLWLSSSSSSSSSCFQAMVSKARKQKLCFEWCGMSSHIFYFLFIYLLPPFDFWHIQRRDAHTFCALGLCFLQTKWNHKVIQRESLLLSWRRFPPLLTHGKELLLSRVRKIMFSHRCGSAWHFDHFSSLAIPCEIPKKKRKSRLPPAPLWTAS